MKSLAVLSTGEVIDNPKHLLATPGAWPVFRRSAPGAKAGRRPGSFQELAALGSRSAAICQDRPRPVRRAPQATTRLAKSHAVVVVEDLNIKAMTASAKGTGHWKGKAGLIGQSSTSPPASCAANSPTKPHGTARCWSQPTVVPVLQDVLGVQGSESQTVSSERTYRCEHCGLVIDRDADAAGNLASLVGDRRYRQWGGNRPERTLAEQAGRRTGSCLRAGGRRRTAKTAPTAPADQCHKTVTAAQQSTAA